MAAARLLALIVLAAGCAKPFMVDGNKVSKRWYDTYSEVVRKRAAYDISCPAENLKLVLLNVSEGYPQTFGVEGCEQKVVYIRPYGSTTWVLNSSGNTD